MSALSERLGALTAELNHLKAAFNIDGLVIEKAELEAQMCEPGFWQDSDASARVVERLKKVKAETAPYQDVEARSSDAGELLQLAEEEEDAETLAELEGDIEALERELGKMRFRAQMQGENDHRDVYLTIQAGAGGTEACDWANMLLRMYTRYLEGQGWGVKLLELQPGEETGVKAATLEVTGSYVYGSLRSEVGVHRLVRISPYDANKRRHTTFAAVLLTPIYDEDIAIEINPADLRVDTFRAGGAGGQHVNKTDSAVRLTHLPTNVVVSCQNERSQHQNRRVAMQMLRAKLFQLAEKQRDEELQKVYGDKGEIAWGNQIRSYVLHPYQMVKDHRTSVETSNTSDVLDGDLEAFVAGYLSWRLDAGGEHRQN